MNKAALLLAGVGLSLLTSPALAQKYTSTPYTQAEAVQDQKAKEQEKGQKEGAVFDPADLSDSEIELLLQREGPADLLDAREVLEKVCDPKAKKHVPQVNPGVRIYRFQKHTVMDVCTGIGATTWIEFPEWEEITGYKPVLGDDSVFGSIEYDNRSLSLKAFKYGVDSTLHVRGKSGNLYTFFVKAVGTNFEAVPDATVFVYANNPTPRKASASPTSHTEKQAQPALDDLKEQAAIRPKKPEYKRRKPFNWNEADCNTYNTWAQNEAGQELMPERVCTDGFWTVFDLGDKSDNNRRVTVYHVVDKTDQPIRPQIRGDRNQLLMIPRTGRFTLGIGEAVICAEMVARADSYEDHPNG